MRSILCALAAAALLALAIPAAVGADVCANRLCTKYEQGTESCWNRSGRAAISRCFIYRAAKHYGQSTRLALQIAHRESRLNWRV
ncbi:MAG: hypothetical protein M3320_02240, partial [Actinomycetota bacterium]|nr:hypothetical protein [Actinomycetota bacterium]